MRNWKTTTFGFIGGLGAAIVAGIRTGVIDGSHLPDWVNAVAGICSIIGSVGLGVVAHDSQPPPENKVEKD